MPRLNARGKFVEDKTVWPYGRIWVGATGKPTYYIRRTIHGRAFEVSTRRSSLEAALEEYRRFERAPSGYTALDAGPKPVTLDATLRDAFLAYSLKQGRKRTGNTDKYVSQQKGALNFWSERLHGLDLRAAGRPGQVRLQAHILPALFTANGKEIPGYNPRVNALRCLYSWLWKVEGRIDVTEDPVRDRLHAKPSSSAMLTGSKHLILRSEYEAVLNRLYDHQRALPQRVHAILQAAREELAAVGAGRFRIVRVAERAGMPDSTLLYYFTSKRELLRALSGTSPDGQRRFRSQPKRWADMVFVVGGTGWHLTELNRFMSGNGVIGQIPAGTESLGGAGVLAVTHKNGDPHPQRVSQACLEAARRLLGTGGFDQGKLRKIVKAACLEIGVRPFTPGMLRHMFIVHALENGASMQEVADAVGHRSIATTGIYAPWTATRKVPSIV